MNAPPKNHQTHFPYIASLHLSVFTLTLLLLAACDIHFGAIPTPTLTPTTPPIPILTVVWVQSGDLFAWRENNPTPLKIASVGVIQPYLAPDGRHVAFTRGQQGDAGSLWAVGIDGAGEQQWVKPDTLKSLRNGHPQIDHVKWLDTQTVYFNTLQRYDSGSVSDDDLYRASLDGSDPQLILPPGAGGDFALSPDGQHIAVIRAGIYDTVKGQLAILDPLGVHVTNKLTFTALRAPSEVPFYPPLSWSGDSTFVRVPIPSRDNDRVALWRVPLEGDAAIFGYITATPVGLPVWSADPGISQMIYLRAALAPDVVDLLIADANGENEQVYDSGSISDLRWFPNGDRFAYDKDGVTRFGRRGETAAFAPVQRAVLLSDSRYVFIDENGLHATDLAGNAPTIIANPLPDDAPFDAGVAP